MKKKLVLIFVIVISFIVMQISGYASTAFPVTVDGNLLEFDEQPMIVNGKPILPLKDIFEALGVKVIWNEDGRTIRGFKDDLNITLKIGSKLAYINDREILLDRPILKKNGTPMIAINFISEGLRAKVDWNYDERELSISSANEIKVHFIDVDQGEAIFIDYGDYDILIDSGGNEKGEIVANYLEKLSTDDIDILVITHPDNEHIGGLKEVLEEFKVKKLIHSGIKDIQELNKDYFSLMQDGSFTTFMKDDNLIFDLGNGVLFQLIETGDNYNNINNNSVVALLEHNDVKFLFTGDMESDAELKNLNKFTDINILKVGNHGSNLSTSDLFLDKIKPEIAIISAGKINEYEYPHKEVIQSLQERNIDIYGTWEYGNIIITADGINYEVDNSSINGIVIKGIDFKNHKILIKNLNDKDLDLSGYKVTNKKGDQIFYIPTGAVIKAGKQAVFDLIKDGEETDHEKYSNMYNSEAKSDSGFLYDKKGNLISKYPN